LKEFDLDYVTTLILTEHLHLWVSPQRCTHQSIDQVDVYSIRSIRTGARTPPPTLLFSSQQCQRAFRLTETEKREPQSVQPSHQDRQTAEASGRTARCRTNPPMKMFYPNPFRRSTPFSKIFSKSGSTGAVHQYPGKLRRSQRVYSPLRLLDSDQ